MATEPASTDPNLETDLWRWLLFESGLSRRRAREIILQGAQSNALSLFWQAGPTILAQQLGLSPEETELLRNAQASWPQIQTRFQVERDQGLTTLRINEGGYPTTLIRFLPAERRPLLLFARGEIGLLELPMALPVADTPPDEMEIAWMLETLADLTAEGALALFIARPGFEARGVKTFLEAGIPFSLVIPQGLTVYAPPANLQHALDADRALLVSPFQPEWQPPATGENPMLPHALAFASAFAHALLVLTSPAPAPAAGQPCFRRPGVTATDHCPDEYDDAEGFFLRLAEAAAPIPPGVTTRPQPSPAEELPPLSPEEIIDTLAQGGHIPPALAARLRKH